MKQQGGGIGPIKSVMPTVRSTNTPDGVRVEARQDFQDSPAFFYSFGTFLTISSLVFGGLFFWLFGAAWYTFIWVLVALIGIMLIRSGNEATKLAKTYGTPALYLETQLPLWLGQRLKVRYQQPVMRNVRLLSADATLVCQEWVHAVQGRNKGKSTETSIVWKGRLPTQTVIPIINNELQVEWNVDVPLSQPASFVAKHNKVEWYLRVVLQAEAMPISNMVFPLVVRPEVK